MLGFEEQRSPLLTENRREGRVPDRVSLVSDWILVRGSTGEKSIVGPTPESSQVPQSSLVHSRTRNEAQGRLETHTRGRSEP